MQKRLRLWDAIVIKAQLAPEGTITMIQVIKELATFDNFQKLDLRVGAISSVEAFPRTKNPSYKIEVDFGPLGRKWSSAQITNYAFDDLLGRQVICIVNFPPRNIAGFHSEILILGVPDTAGRTILLQPTETIPLGGAAF
ncbi:MAG: tRNA-binding protein [Beijerinckiaceae bacterium]